MRLERRPGYEAFVGRWEAQEHAAEMASPAARYFGLRDGAALRGFVILQELDRPVALLRRIAVASCGVRRTTGLRHWYGSSRGASGRVKAGG